MRPNRHLRALYTKPLVMLAALLSSLNSLAETPATDDELTPFFHRMVTYHSRMDSSVPDKATLFIGDSITQALAVSAVTERGVNYGIGGDTTRGVLARLANYKSIERAPAVVLAIGVNDLKHRDNASILQNYRAIFEAMPKDIPILVSAILPVDSRIKKMRGRNPRIIDINGELKKITGEYKQVSFLDVREKLINKNGDLKETYHIVDGIHLNKAGYAVWIGALREELDRQLSYIDPCGPN